MMFLFLCSQAFLYDLEKVRVDQQPDTDACDARDSDGADIIQLTMLTTAMIGNVVLKKQSMLICAMGSCSCW